MHVAHFLSPFASYFCCAHAPNSNTIYEEKTSPTWVVNKASRALWHCCFKCIFLVHGHGVCESQFEREVRQKSDLNASDELAERFSRSHLVCISQKKNRFLSCSTLKLIWSVHMWNVSKCFSAFLVFSLLKKLLNLIFFFIVCHIFVSSFSRMVTMFR